MVLVQKWPFFQLFLFWQDRPRKFLLRILELKNAFLDYKNKTFKESKNGHFSKGSNPWFRFKNGHFSNFFFLSNIDQENVLSDNLERKNAFLGYKKKTFKQFKNGHFSEVVNPWFWSKNGHFSTFFFRQDRPGKFLLRYSRTKKMPL